ncbi:MAG TPA: cytochrome c3 family protein [Bryobacteraceae bacterium]|nr:cytochrome c3 family protein [Bryobacteraceae bacterium]
MTLRSGTFFLTAAIAMFCGFSYAADQEAGRILRPADNSSHAAGQVDLVATAPSGKLQLDGAPVQTEQPFPNVFHATLKASPGAHSLVLEWEGGRKEVRFFVGPNAPAPFQPFRQHPPTPGVQCSQCHELNRRGRFVFKGGCFDCHQRDGFAKAHTHEPGTLEQCGICHNAHGSTVKAHLLYSKETACRICHGN